MVDILEQQQPGIRNHLYLGGVDFVRDPNPIQISIRRHEAKTRTANLSLRVDRPQTTPGLPNVRNRCEFSLPWTTVFDPPLIEHLDALAAKGQPFDLGLWKQATDIWDGDAETAEFLMQRRQLLPNKPPQTEWPDYPTRIYMLDKPFGDPTAVVTDFEVVDKNSVDILVSAPAAGIAWVETTGHKIGGLHVTRVRLGTVPPNVKDCLVAIYIPLYKVVIDQEAERSYAEFIQEPRGLKLIEA